MKHIKPFQSFEKKLTCGIYLFDCNNKLLIQHPTGFRPSVWGIPKGRVDEGEVDLFQVAKRELEEETGIILDKLTIIGYKEFDEVKYKDSNKYLKGFFVKVSEDLLDFNLHCSSMVIRNGKPSFPEVDDWKWVDIEEAEKIFSSDGMTDFQIDNINKSKELIK